MPVTRADFIKSARAAGFRYATPTAYVSRGGNRAACYGDGGLRVGAGESVPGSSPFREN